MAPVGLRAHRSPLEGSSAPSMVPLTQKSYFKDLIPRTQLSQDRKNKEPPSFGEHLLCARPVLSMESHHIQSLQPPDRSILQMKMLRPSRACADPDGAIGKVQCRYWRGRVPPRPRAQVLVPGPVLLLGLRRQFPKSQLWPRQPPAIHSGRSGQKVKQDRLWHQEV